MKELRNVVREMQDRIRERVQEILREWYEITKGMQEDRENERRFFLAQDGERVYYLRMGSKELWSLLCGLWEMEEWAHERAVSLEDVDFSILKAIAEKESEVREKMQKWLKDYKKELEEILGKE